ncbi:FAD-binding domain-containing protein [Infundibulicybe gibba]|nr:FAD-binding domain-containing protein [Infundibulicybe gibba]
MTTIQGFSGTVVTPSSPDYEQAIRRVSATSILRPAYVAFPKTPADITRALEFARAQTPRWRLRSRAADVTHLRLRHLRAVRVSEDKKTVAFQGGAVWGDVYTELTNHNLVVVGGNVWFVGVGGHITGGGYSNISGHHGLAIDNLIEATVVLADGKVVKCNAQNEPDLFWAIRGGGNQFGIVTEFVVNTFPAPGPTLVGALAYPGTELSNVLKLVREFLEKQTPKMRIMLAFARAPPHFHPGITIIPYIEGDTQEAEKIIAPFRTTVTPVFERIGSAPNQNAVTHGADAMLANVPPRSAIGGALFTDLWDDVVGQVFGEWRAFTEKEETRASMVMWEFGYRDRIAEVKASDTAYPARSPHYYVLATGRHTQPSSDASTREWVSRIATLVKDANTEKTGVKLPTPGNFSLGPDSVGVEEVYGSNLARLRKLKAKYDPKKVWSRGWVIEPDFD